MASVLCLDFDNVIVEQDLTALVLERFAPGEPEESHAPGEGARIRALQSAFARVEASPEELLAFVREMARPRDGLDALYDWCRDHDWMPVIVSHGFGFAVGAVLHDLGLDRVPFHAGRARFAYRWRLSYLSPRGVELQDGFQLSYVSSLRQAGDFVAMVGGPHTSTQAVKAANVAFVPDLGAASPASGAPRRYEWRTFSDVLVVLDRDFPLPVAGSGTA